MKTKKYLLTETGLTKQGLTYRINQMKKSGIVISSEYQETNRAPIRVFTDEIAQMIIDWRGKKPGRKRQDVEKATCPQCNGSGEGMHDGTKCKLCKGSGVEC